MKYIFCFYISLGCYGLSLYTLSMCASIYIIHFTFIPPQLSLTISFPQSQPASSCNLEKNKKKDKDEQCILLIAQLTDT